jgi:two-component system cell cycle sensor histidine kinase/response regulator CckA
MAGESLNNHGPWERLPVALYRTTPDGRVLEVNAAFVECFRAPSRESLLQMRADALYLDPHDRARWTALLESQGVVRHFEAQMRRLDGTTFWACDTARAHKDARGTVVAYEGLVEDITHSKGSEQWLRASEIRYRRLFESAKDGILILDAETAEIVEANPFLCDLLGMSHQEVVGKKLWEVGPFKDVPASKINFRQLQAAEYIRYEDLPLETAKGLKIAVEFVSNVYRAAGHKVIQCNIRDITERKLAAEAQAVLTRAVECAAESVIVTDAQGTMVYVNPAFERVSGWSRQEMLGQNPRILKSGKHDAAFYQRMWKILNGGEVWQGRMVNRRKDGTLFEEDASISPVRDAAGRIVNYVAVKRDVTDETRLALQLAQSQRVEAVGRLAGGVAHDFNNLLGIIMGYGGIVRRQLPREDPLRGKVEEMVKAAERAADLTRQLLAFSRQQILQPKILDLNSVVSEMETMLHRLIGEDVVLATQLEPQLGCVKADPGQIGQVIMNLAVNARDAMPEGGRITIETRSVELDADYAATHPPLRPGAYVMLSVTDTGSGMDAATQALIFEPFFTTKEVGKGTGLGLATVYGIVKQSGGDVWVYSEVGVGTTFKVYLPRVDEAVPLARAQGPSRPLGGSETVLLVEDEAALRELLREVLEANGYSTLVARDGAEALQIVDAHGGPIQIAVTDVILPDMTGPQVVEIVAQARPEMKVLYISGYSDESVVRHGLIGPGRAFLSKPFGPEALLQKLRSCLDAG